MGNQLIETFFYGIVKKPEQTSRIFAEDTGRNRVAEIGASGG
jgi:hypothetical protein